MFFLLILASLLSPCLSVPQQGFRTKGVPCRIPVWHSRIVTTKEIDCCCGVVFAKPAYSYHLTEADSGELRI